MFLTTGQGGATPPVWATPLVKGWLLVRYTKGTGERKEWRGPHGERLLQQIQVGGGWRAREMWKDGKTVFYGTYNLQGIEFEVALRADGLLAVSYPNSPDESKRFNPPCDFSATVKTARDAAEVLRYALRYPRGGSDPNLKASLGPVPGDPFLGWVHLPLGYVHRRNEAKNPKGGRYESRGAPTIEYRDKPLLLPMASVEKGRDGLRWKFSQGWYSGQYVVGEANDGRLFATTDGGPSKHVRFAGPTFWTKATTPRAALTLILTRLSYRPKTG